MLDDGPFSLPGIEPLELIGTGGFGEVWLARQTSIDRKVAIKVGHNPIDDDTIRIRFQRECKALGRLSGHPNIVDVFTAGELDDGRPYLMLEYVDGGTLWRKLKKAAVEEGELRFIGIELADALSVAHGAEVLHRDLKPENILLRRNGEAVLGDFGIARLQDGANTTSHPITASVAYAAPEILTGKDASIASDLYGLGVCLLTAGIGGVPFMEPSDDSVHPIIERVLADDPPDLRDHGYSEPFAELVGSLLSKQGKRRPATAAEVRDELYRITEDDPLPSMRDEHEHDDDLDPADLDRQSDGSAVARGRSGRNPPQTLRAAAGAPAAVAARPALEPDAQTNAAGARPAAAAGPARPAEVSESWTRSDVLRIGGAVLGALLLVAGIAAFALFDGLDAILGDDEATTAVVSPEPLGLPLPAESLLLGADASVEPDSAGPNSSQFCDNTPETSGLTAWTGQTNAGSPGYPVIFQQLARFDTPQNAERYVATYAAGVDCTAWTIPGNDDGPPIVVLPRLIPPSAEGGEQAVEVAFEGADGLSLSGRVVVVRQGIEVYTLSVTSVEPTDVDRLEPLLTEALTTLGY
ncbi:MAG: serine/threonine-protein kinase [Actinomycetota bacterium]